MKHKTLYNLILFIYSYELESLKYKLNTTHNNFSKNALKFNNYILIKKNTEIYSENLEYRNTFNSLYLKKNTLKKIYTNIVDYSFFKEKMIYYLKKDSSKLFNFDQNLYIKSIKIKKLLDENNKIIYSFKNTGLYNKQTNKDADFFYKQKKISFYKKLKSNKKLSKKLKDSGLNTLTIIPKLTYYQKQILYLN